ncbi:hypothetical protein ACLB2K_017236 [Fragaria x ananassa]
MLENEMEESLSGTIKIGDVSYDALRAFVNYLYTAEACLDEEMACHLILAEKYQVQHLKDYCEKCLVSKLNWDNSIVSYTFAHQHNAKHVVDAALTWITDNMDKLTTREEYMDWCRRIHGSWWKSMRLIYRNRLTLQHRRILPDEEVLQSSLPPPGPQMIHQSNNLIRLLLFI